MLGTFFRWPDCFKIYTWSWYWSKSSNHGNIEAHNRRISWNIVKLCVFKIKPSVCKKKALVIQMLAGGTEGVPLHSSIENLLYTSVNKIRAGFSCVNLNMQCICTCVHRKNHASRTLVEMLVQLALYKQEATDSSMHPWATR